MSTRSLIGKLNDDGTVRFIYCDWDGYPENNGEILLTRYNTPESIETLLALGDLSALGESLESCVAYGRDRGEKGTEARTFPKNEFLNDRADALDVEYVYLFEGGAWSVYEARIDDDLRRKAKALGNVAEVLERLKKESASA